MNPLHLLFFGDIVGKPGRKAVMHYLAHNPSPDNQVVLANAENATHGYGLSQAHYLELQQAGVHVFTGGNHTWDRKDIVQWLPEAPNVLRPANMLSHLPGRGAGVFTVKGYTFGVLNLMGQTFMGAYNSPWEAIDAHLPILQQASPVVFIDTHAEATAEKLSLAHYCARRGASAFVGTHTHVQTADDRLLHVPDKPTMGYLTDAGFNGSYDSVIGMDVDACVRRMRGGVHEHLSVAEHKDVQINAVRFSIDPSTGHCLSVERINTRVVLP